MSDFSFTFDTATRHNGMQIVDGDFLDADDLETALEISLFSEARATADEMLKFSEGRQQPARNRGWWANTYKNIELGSRLWLLIRRKREAAVISAANRYARTATQWLTDIGITKDITITSAFNGDILEMTVALTRQNDIAIIKQYRFVWDDLPSPVDQRIRTDLTPEGNTLTLLYFYGSDGSIRVVDYSRDKVEPSNVFAYDGAAVSSARTVFLRPTMSFPEGGFVEIERKSEYDIGTGDFTIEFRSYIDTSGLSDDYYILDYADHSGAYSHAIDFRYLRTLNQIQLDINDSSVFNLATGALNIEDQWASHAISRASGTLRYYINGVEKFSGANTDDIDIGTTYIGADSTLVANVKAGDPAATPDADKNNFVGNIAAYRFSNVARYTSAYSPSTTEFSPYKFI